MRIPWCSRATPFRTLGIALLPIGLASREPALLIVALACLGMARAVPPRAPTP